MTVYLLHFEKPIGDLDNPRGQAQHYIGWAEDLPGRLAEHRAGNGAAITAYLAQERISFELVRTWEGGDRRLERRLKDRHEGPRLCPLCAGEAAWARAKEQQQ